MKIAVELPDPPEGKTWRMKKGLPTYHETLIGLEAKPFDAADTSGEGTYEIAFAFEQVDKPSEYVMVKLRREDGEALKVLTGGGRIANSLMDRFRDALFDALAAEGGVDRSQAKNAAGEPYSEFILDPRGAKPFNAADVSIAAAPEATA